MNGCCKFAIKYAFGLALLPLVVASSASAAVIWADDFNRASGPLTLDYTSNGTNDYGTATNAGYASLSGGSLRITDAASDNFRVSVNKSQFLSTTLSAGDQVTISYDISVASHLGNAASAPRFTMLDNAADLATSSSLTIGLGQVGTSYGFYYSQNVGAVGTSVLSLGTYDTTSGSNNNTGGNFYRVSMSFIQGSNAVTGSVTNLGNPAQNASFSTTTASAFDWNGNTTGIDGFQFQSGAGGQGVYSFDNISVSVVPEPSSFILLGSGLSLFVMTRRDRRQAAI